MGKPPASRGCRSVPSVGGIKDGVVEQDDTRGGGAGKEGKGRTDDENGDGRAGWVAAAGMRKGKEATVTVRPYN